MFSLTKRKFPNQTSRQHRSKYNIVHTNHEYECPASRAARPTIYIFTPVIAYLTHILHLCRQACYSPQRNVDTQRRASRTKRGVHYAESSLSWTSTLITSRPRCHGGQGVCDRLKACSLGRCFYFAGNLTFFHSCHHLYPCRRVWPTRLALAIESTNM
ncbi:unnamed protein product [Ectocarpus fasciculatus]